jgi:hypothetical protein
MTTFLVFIISLGLIALLFFMKSLEIYHGRKIFLEKQFENFDAWIANTLLKVKYWWSHVSFKNTRLIFLWILASIYKLVVAVKRRFDHEQSHFFTKREHVSTTKKKVPVSFFLKDVSDYKKSLREGNESGEKKM